MTYFVINLLLALLWASLQDFRPIDFLGGFILGYGIIWMSREWLGWSARRYVLWVIRFVSFLIYYIGELVLSTYQVIIALFRNQSSLKPGIVAFDLTAQTDLEIVLLNNLLIFTPGTLGVDLSPDRRVLYIHIIDVPDPDAACQRIRDGLERRLLEVLR